MGRLLNMKVREKSEHCQFVRYQSAETSDMRNVSAFSEILKFVHKNWYKIKIIIPKQQIHTKISSLLQFSDAIEKNSDLINFQRCQN